MVILLTPDLTIKSSYSVLPSYCQIEQKNRYPLTAPPIKNAKKTNVTIKSTLNKDARLTATSEVIDLDCKPWPNDSMPQYSLCDLLI